MRDAEKSVGKIFDKSTMATLCYLEEEDDDPTPTIRAILTPREREGVRVFYLTGGVSPQKKAGLREKPEASLYFLNRYFNRGVCLSGTVEVLDDSASKKRLWRTGDTMYYRQGVTDPDYCVLKFTAVRGRYYSNFKSENFAIPD